MAKALPLVVGPEAEGTAEMILVVDKMFDCLNVSSLSEGYHKRKPARDPYCNAKDWRLKVVTTTFGNYCISLILLFTYSGLKKSV